MFSKETYTHNAKRKAANYLKMTAAMGIIRSQLCQQVAQELYELAPDDYVGLLDTLKRYTNSDASPRPLKGCHRHFLDELKMLYKQIKYDRELQEVIDGHYAMFQEADEERTPS